jgi:hypothetical protein|tara:strand:- start:440 stop:604 length:165 start_codon:yes stop_codon:yes gene_type:complete
MIPLFKSEAEVISYAKVNGYDVGGTSKLLANWKAKQAELENPVAVPKPAKSKKD